MIPTARLAFSVFTLALAALPSAALANPASSAAPQSAPANPPSMEFRLVEGRSALGLRRWIQASGPITDETPARFRAFAREHNVRGLTVALDSLGGSGPGGIGLGRAFRLSGVNTTVGRTVVSAEGGRRTATLVTYEAPCHSACSYALLGGHERRIPTDAIVGLHQFGRATPPSAEELQEAQRFMAIIAIYLQDMGIDMRFLALATRHPYGATSHPIDRNEQLDLNVATPVDLHQSSAGPVGWAISAHSDEPGLYRRVITQESAQRRVDEELFLRCSGPNTIRGRARLILARASAGETLAVTALTVSFGSANIRWRANEGQVFRIPANGGLWMNFEISRQAVLEAAERGQLVFEVQGGEVAPTQLGTGLAEVLPDFLAACDARHRLATAAR